MALESATIVEKTVGTAGGRDATTVALALALVGNPGSDGTILMLTLFPDSVFTESNTLFPNFITSIYQKVIIRADSGAAYSGVDGVAGNILFKPTGGTFILLNNTITGNAWELQGCEFDGSGGFIGLSGNGLCKNRAGNFKIERCSFHDNPLGSGFFFDFVTGLPSCTNSVFHKNEEHGIGNSSAGDYSVFHCGFKDNGQGGTGFGCQMTGIREVICFDSWFDGNASGSIQRPLTLTCGWNFVSDTAFSTFGGEFYEISENVTFTSSDFVDAPNGNFLLKDGSQLIKKGSPLFMKVPAVAIRYREDVTGTGMDLSSALSTDQSDLGFHQFSYAAAPITDAPIVS